MGLERLVKEGWFDDSYELVYDLSPIKEKLLLARLLNKKKVLVSSRKDLRVYEFIFLTEERVQINQLPICLQGTSAMANMTKERMEQYLGVDFVIEDSLVIKVKKEIPSSWWNRLKSKFSKS